MAEQLIDLPSGIPPLFTTERPNAPVELYSGPIVVSAAGATFDREARISLEWLPGAAIIANMAPDTGAEMEWFVNSTPLSVSIPELHIETDASVSSVTIGEESAATLHLGPCKMTTNDQCSYLIFQVANFVNYIGAGISFQERSGTAGRMELASDRWRITLDQTPNCGDLEKQLKKDGGFAITHTGRLECADGSDFPIADGLLALDALRWFLTFCGGRFIGIPFKRGVDADGNHVYEEWLPPIVSPWKDVVSWFPKQTIGDAALAFGQFLRLCNDPDWYDTLQFAIHWYVNANENVAALEGSIVLAQIALERLAWMVIVVERNAISRDGFENLHASDQFNLLLNQLGIPKHIPPSLKQLAAYCKRIPANSLSECITIFRNRIVHPPKKNRMSPGTDVLREAWKASMWVLELAILSLLEYRGCYVNRIDPQAKWVGQTELVPWAPASEGRVPQTVGKRGKGKRQE